MFTERHRDELKTKGMTVVEGVLEGSLCQSCVAQYDEWLSEFTEKGAWPRSYNSIIHHYSIGYSDPSWRVRLAAKPVFSKLWGTDKLLSSVDAIAVGRPPEGGEEPFHTPGEHWLHVDQFPEQRGLHSYQGAVYLETADEDDWTFCVIEGSHNLLEEFKEAKPDFNIRIPNVMSCRLQKDDTLWFEERGCKLKRVPVPRGGMVLWDSRLVHANARALQGRQHAGRWRRVVFVCMTPAIWAPEKDIEKKVDAYNRLVLTAHRASQYVVLFPKSPPEGFIDIPAITEMPEIGRSEDAKRLCGVVKYDFDDGEPNGPDWSPKWDNDVIRQ
ncbi:uncharacterized protein LOC135475962 [Liolophura sinensis]|uniref:uncharacterized protein LOC135475962 n=1 Tax=Liolophura sinensis TaxID=3198878 RepID=UPI003159646B